MPKEAVTQNYTESNARVSYDSTQIKGGSTDTQIAHASSESLLTKAFYENNILYENNKPSLVSSIFFILKQLHIPSHCISYALI